MTVVVVVVVVVVIVVVDFSVVEVEVVVVEELDVAVFGGGLVVGTVDAPVIEPT